jgi:hypothetical protein
MHVLFLVHLLQVAGKSPQRVRLGDITHADDRYHDA